MQNVTLGLVDRHGNNPLHVAAHRGLLQVMVNLLLNFEPDVRPRVMGVTDRSGNPLLHTVANSGQAAHIFPLLELIPESFRSLMVLKKNVRTGESLFHRLALGGKTQELQQVLQFLPASTHRSRILDTSYLDKNSLHFAAKSGVIETMNLLFFILQDVEVIVDALLSGDRDGNTVFHHATPKMMLYLLELFGTQATQLMPLENNQGQNLVTLMAMQGDKAQMAALLDFLTPAQQDQLLETAKTGDTIVRFAAQRGLFSCHAAFARYYTRYHENVSLTDSQLEQLNQAFPETAFRPTTAII